MPSFNFVGNVTGRNSATLFEIRLDNDIIVLRGGESEASSQLLKGVVVLCLPSALKVEDVHLRMTGMAKVGWIDQRMTPTGMSTNKVERVNEIFSHRWAPFVGGNGPGSSSKGTVLPSGNYEWPFELIIPGTMAESVEGMTESNIIYKLKATVARGKLAYDLHAWKPVRIVRTLDPSALELAHAMTVENVWPNKIEYQLIIPQKAIIFGTAIDVEMRFTSLLKGLRIGQIKCILIEVQEFVIAGPSVNTERFWRNSRDIESWTFDLDENSYQDMLNEDGQDGYALTKKLELPKSLSKCLQDVDVHGIKIRHKVKFNIALHNPDGHVSELRATLPVTIFISPNMPMTADGRLVDQTPMSTQTVDIVQHAPPLYGEHVLDQLYADVDHTGIMTPAPQSGMNTPFPGLSRAGSHENLSSLNEAAHLGHSSNGAVQAAILSSRLQNLNNSSRNSSFRRLHGNHSGSNTPAGEPDYFDHPNHSGNRSGNHSNPHSNPLSRRNSEDDGSHHHSQQPSGQQTPDNVDYSNLTKVPSYGTAIATPARGMSYTEAVPNYAMATSAPPSPERRYSHMSSQPTTPGVEDGSGSANGSGNRRSHHPFSSFGFTPIQSPGASDDGARRLHILQSRGRGGH